MFGHFKTQVALFEDRQVKERPNHSMHAWHFLLLFTEVCNSHSYKDLLQDVTQINLAWPSNKGKKEMK